MIMVFNFIKFLLNDVKVFNDGNGTYFNSTGNANPTDKPGRELRRVWEIICVFLNASRKSRNGDQVQQRFRIVINYWNCTTKISS